MCPCSSKLFSNKTHSTGTPCHHDMSCFLQKASPLEIKAVKIWPMTDAYGIKDHEIDLNYASSTTQWQWQHVKRQKQALYHPHAASLALFELLALVPSILMIIESWVLKLCVTDEAHFLHIHFLLMFLCTRNTIVSGSVKLPFVFACSQLHNHFG